MFFILLGSHPSGYWLNGPSQWRSGSRSYSNLHSQLDALLEHIEMMKYLYQAYSDIDDLKEFERDYFAALFLGQQGRQVPLNYQYPGTCMLHPGNPYTKCIHSRTIPRVQFRNEGCSPFPTRKVQVSGSSGSCNTSSGSTVKGKLSSSLLEELKSRTRSMELLDVLDDFVEFR